MLFKKALETAKKSGVYKNKSDSYSRELQKHSNADHHVAINLETLSGNHKKYFNINNVPSVFMPMDNAFVTPKNQQYKPFVSGSSISKGQANNEMSTIRYKEELDQFINHSIGSFTQ